VDLFPTVCDLACIERPPHLQGNSLAGLFLQSHAKDYQAREYALCEEGYYRTLRTRRYKLVYAPPHYTWGDGQGFTSQLYDLEKDPGEWENRFEDPAYAEIRQRLIETLLAATCASELPLQRSCIQRITPAEHVAEYGQGYESLKRQIRQAQEGLGQDPFEVRVYLRTEGEAEWAGGG
jgi:hypothetical protein